MCYIAAVRSHTLFRYTLSAESWMTNFNCADSSKNGTYEKRSGVMSQHFSANEFDTLGKSGGVTFNYRVSDPHTRLITFQMNITLVEQRSHQF